MCLILPRHVIIQCESAPPKTPTIQCESAPPKTPTCSVKGSAVFALPLPLLQLLVASLPAQTSKPYQRGCGSSTKTRCRDRATSQHPRPCYCLPAAFPRFDLSRHVLSTMHLKHNTKKPKSCPAVCSTQPRSLLLSPCHCLGCSCWWLIYPPRPPSLLIRLTGPPPELSTQPGPHHSTPALSAAAACLLLVSCPSNPPNTILSCVSIYHTTPLLAAANLALTFAGAGAAAAVAECGKVPAFAASLQPDSFLESFLQLLV